jgi:hypothetical protein
MPLAAGNTNISYMWIMWPSPFYLDTCKFDETYVASFCMYRYLEIGIKRVNYRCNKPLTNYNCKRKLKLYE